MSQLSDSDDALVPVLRTCQIIVIALITGVVLFLAIVLLLGPILGDAEQGKPDAAPHAAPGPPMITYLALAFGAINLVMSFVIPNLVATQGRKGMAKSVSSNAGKGDDTETVRFLPLYQTQLIIGSALLEGAAFFAGIAYMLERNPLALGMAGVLLGVLLTRFPTLDRLRGWLDKQAVLYQDDRQAVL